MTDFFDETGIIRKEILFRNFMEGVFFRFNFFVFLGRALRPLSANTINTIWLQNISWK